MDLFAGEIGIDPADVRRPNLIGAFAEPHTTVIGQTYDVGNYPEALDKVLAAAGYAELRAEQARRRDAGDPVQLGIGVSCYVEITGGVPPLSEAAKIEVQRRRLGRRLHRHLAARAGPHHVVVDDRRRRDRHRHGQDRRPLGRHRPRAGGRRHDGLAVAAAGWRRRAAGVDRAGGQGQGPGGQAARGRRRRRRARQGRRGASTWPARPRWPGRGPSWPSPPSRRATGLGVDTVFEAGGATFPFGAHVAVVEVDTDTGQVRPLRHVALDDAGRVLNPLLLEGQIHGGIAQGAAQALLEEFRYDEDGNPVTGNFADYAFPSAAELPELRDRPHGDADAASTRSAPRASASRARSAPRRRCSRPWSTPCAPSACATSTCRPPASGCGRPSRRAS